MFEWILLVLMSQERPTFCLAGEEKRKMMAEFEAEKKTWLKVMDDTNNGSHSSLQREENISTGILPRIRIVMSHTVHIV